MSLICFSACEFKRSKCLKAENSGWSEGTRVSSQTHSDQFPSLPLAAPVLIIVVQLGHWTSELCADPFRLDNSRTESQVSFGSFRCRRAVFAIFIVRPLQMRFFKHIFRAQAVGQVFSYNSQSFHNFPCPLTISSPS